MLPCEIKPHLFVATTEDTTIRGVASRTLAARKLCATCPIKLQCLIDAIGQEADGVRGGTSAYMRRTPAFFPDVEAELWKAGAHRAQVLACMSLLEERTHVRREKERAARWERKLARERRARAEERNRKRSNERRKLRRQREREARKAESSASTQ